MHMKGNRDQKGNGPEGPKGPQGPLHIAIIMDGNGRWAAKRGLPRSEGHRRGMDVVRKVITQALDQNISCLTLYAFSSENWVRPEKEISFLMKMCGEMITGELPYMIKNDIRFIHIGDIEGLPDGLKDALRRTMDLTKNNRKLSLLLAFNYGGRAEIVRAARKLSLRVKESSLSPEEIDEKVFADSLYTAGLPDPDLLIRTSGEMRISNFLLWQLCYTEIYVTKTLWPDFGKRDFLKAISVFRKRTRRFGGIQ